MIGLPRSDAALPVVECRGVTVKFGDFTAIHDINLCVEDKPGHGEFISIIGPSGCGKSTLLNLIAGFQKPTSGEVRVKGEVVRGPGRDRGMIFQEYSSFPHLTVLQNVMFGMKINGRKMGLSGKDREDRARELIQATGLEGHERKYPNQLSGGQRQRVAIARSLAMEPRILLMDEPFSALDEPTRLEMQHLVIKLWKRVQPTILCITHSVTEAVYLGEHVWIFTQAPGQIAYDIRESIPPNDDLPPLDAQERPQFKEAVRVVTEAFLRIGESKPGGSAK
ncbi:MAG: ABC transporter ATP-binding protein [Planctomycetota bacterium]|nr:ABC transporter ATP-binding protein [Planctomycetota bacterium]